MRYRGGEAAQQRGTGGEAIDVRVLAGARARERNTVCLRCRADPRWRDKSGIRVAVAVRCSICCAAMLLPDMPLIAAVTPRHDAIIARCCRAMPLAARAFIAVEHAMLLMLIRHACCRARATRAASSADMLRCYGIFRRVIYAMAMLFTPTAMMLYAAAP